MNEVIVSIFIGLAGITLFVAGFGIGHVIGHTNGMDRGMKLGFSRAKETVQKI